MTEIGQFWIAFRSCSKDFGIQLSQNGRSDSKTFHRITWFYRGFYFIDHILLCFSMKIEIQKCIFLGNHSNFRYRPKSTAQSRWLSFINGHGRHGRPFWRMTVHIFKESCLTENSHFQRIVHFLDPFASFGPAISLGLESYTL